MSVSKAKTSILRNQKNRRYRRSKLSEYRFLKVVECFAMDLLVRQTAVRTRISERSIRDIYKGLRGRMVKYALGDPKLFGGFGGFVCDEEGMVTPESMNFMDLMSKSKRFKAWIKTRFPRSSLVQTPLSYPVMEYFVRRFVALEPPSSKLELMNGIRYYYDASEDTLRMLLQGKGPEEDVKKYYLLLSQFLVIQNAFGGSISYERLAHNAIFRDMKTILLKEPL